MIGLASKPQNHKTCMIVKWNNKSTTEGERRITLFAINCGTIQMLTWIMAKVEHWNWLLKK
jgi:hypothetical protein